MKNLEAHFKEIKKQYPKTMSKDQLYRVAHISKATALYLLQSGAIPCKDTGKKTRRYTIKTDDVIEYLRQREICPEKYKASEGWYAGTAGAKKAIAPSCWITLTPEQTKKFELFFEAEMKEMADLITIEELAVFAGYKSTSVVNWCSSKKMKAFKIGGKYFIPKECAIKYLASAAMCRNPQQSYRYKLFVTESFPPCDFWWKLSEDGSTQRKPKSCGILRILASVFRFYLNPQGFPSSSHFCPEL